MDGNLSQMNSELDRQEKMSEAFHKWCTKIGNLCIAMHVEELKNDSNEEMAKSFMDGVTPEQFILDNQV